MIDLLEVLKGFTGKRVRISFYIGSGGGLHYFSQVGYIMEVSDHKVVVNPDPTVKGDYPIIETTLLTEFVAIYAVDELDLDQPITVEEEGKPREFDDVISVKDVSPNDADQWLNQGYTVQTIYAKNLILVKRKPKEPLKETPEEFKEVEKP